MTFLNTSIQLVILNFIIKRSQAAADLWKDNGLASDLWFLLLLAVLDILGPLMTPENFMKVWYRRRVEKGIGKNESFRPNQGQVNTIFEGFDFCFEERLQKYCKTLLICLFISSLFPLSPLIASIYLVGFYWADKYFLIHFCRVPNFCTSQIGHSMLRFFDFALVIYTVIISNSGWFLAVSRHHFRNPS